MRSVSVPVKNAVLRGGERLGRTTEFHKRFDVLRQQTVVELIDLVPVVSDLAIVVGTVPSTS
jgi:hypothetical protein